MASELLQQYIANNKLTENLQDYFTAVFELCIKYPTERGQWECQKVIGLTKKKLLD